MLIIIIQISILDQIFDIIEKSNNVDNNYSDIYNRSDL